MLNKILTLFVFLVSVICFTSCLKSGSNYNDALIQATRSTGDKPVIEIALTATATSNVHTAGVPLLFVDTTVKLVPIVLASANSAPFDIKVRVAVKDSILNDYIESLRADKDSETFYNFPDTSLYSLADNGDVIIPSGSNLGYLKVKLNPSKFFKDTLYALPIYISSVPSGFKISSNLSKGIAIIAIRNKYDLGPGGYQSNGYFYHPTVPRVLKRTKTLSTIDANSFQIEVGDLGGANYYAAVTVNSDNTLTIKAAKGAAGAPYTMHTSGLPTSGLPNPYYTPKWDMSSSCNNTYDPATGKFYLRYGYVGGTGWRVTEEIVSPK